MTESKTTPLPWVVNRDEHAYISNVLYKGVVAYLTNNDGAPLMLVNPNDHAVTPEESPANAAFLTMAANAHSELVEALREMLAEYDAGAGPGWSDSPALDKARALLARLATPEGTR